MTAELTALPDGAISDDEEDDGWWQWALGDSNYAYVFGETLLGANAGFSPVLHILVLFCLSLSALGVAINTNYRMHSVLAYFVVCVLHNVFALSK